jgi:hypothetical protein
MRTRCTKEEHAAMREFESQMRLLGLILDSEVGQQNAKLLLDQLGDEMISVRSLVNSAKALGTELTYKTKAELRHHAVRIRKRIPSYRTRTSLLR